MVDENRDITYGMLPNDLNRASVKTKPTPPVHYHITSADPQHYSRLVLTDIISGRCGRLEWHCLAF